MKFAPNSKQPSMKHLLAFIALCLSGTLIAQSPTLEGFYNKYANSPEVTKMNLNGWILNLTFNSAEEEEGFSEKITRVRVLIMEEKNIVPHREYKKLLHGLSLEQFEPLLQVRDKGKDRVDGWIRESGTKITDAILLVYGEDNFAFLNVEGHFTQEDLDAIQLEINNETDWDQP